jgi:hypothetical protein
MALHGSLVLHGVAWQSCPFHFGWPGPPYARLARTPSHSSRTSAAVPNPQNYARLAAVGTPCLSAFVVRPDDCVLVVRSRPAKRRCVCRAVTAVTAHPFEGMHVLAMPPSFREHGFAIAGREPAWSCWRRRVRALDGRGQRVSASKHAHWARTAAHDVPNICMTDACRHCWS